jgi:hypothetical protein
MLLIHLPEGTPVASRSGTRGVRCSACPADVDHCRMPPTLVRRPGRALVSACRQWVDQHAASQADRGRCRPAVTRKPSASSAPTGTGASPSMAGASSLLPATVPLGGEREQPCSKRIRGNPLEPDRAGGSDVVEEVPSSDEADQLALRRGKDRGVHGAALELLCEFVAVGVGAGGRRPGLHQLLGTRVLGGGV